MTIGYNLLVPRNSPAEIEIETLERNLLFKIPPLYREFLLRFKQGEDGLNLEKYFRNDINYYDIIGPAIGVAGTDDFGLYDKMHLVVSGKALIFLRDNQVTHAESIEIDGDMKDFFNSEKKNFWM